MSGSARQESLTCTFPTATARSTATCPPGRGVVDFPPYLRAIKGLGIDDLTISIELEYSPEPDKIVDWVTEAYQRDRLDLMSDAGLRAPASGRDLMPASGATSSLTRFAPPGSDDLLSILSS